MKKNGCIFLISARKHLLQRCLQHLDQNYNNQHNYPVLIFYHGAKYDDEIFRAAIKKINPSTDYSFHKIKAKLPSHIPEKDLFYNLNVPYVKSCFPPQRVGFLHANYFWNNFMNYDELSQFDYLMRIDDDSWFKAPIEFDLFQELDMKNKLCGSAYTWNHHHHRVLDTRINFYSWIQQHCKKYNIIPKNKKLEEYLKEGENDIIDGRKCNKNFHSMNYLCGNCNIYNMKMFQTNEWKEYLSEFNKLGGGYRYRWGDCEIMTMFYYLHLGEEFVDLNLQDKGLYKKQLPTGVGFIHDADLS